jgi:hypothetical protein
LPLNFSEKRPFIKQLTSFPWKNNLIAPREKELIDFQGIVVEGNKIINKSGFFNGIIFV